MANLMYLFVMLSFALCLGVDIEEGKAYEEAHKIDTTKNQEATYLITPNKVGLFSRNMTIGSVIRVMPKNQIQRKIGYGEFPDDTF